MSTVEPIGWLPCTADGTAKDPKDGLFDSELSAKAWAEDTNMAPAVYSHVQLLKKIAAEREACAEACEMVHVRPIQGAHEEYIAGKEMALMQAASAIRKRAAL